MSSSYHLDTASTPHKSDQSRLYWLMKKGAFVRTHPTHSLDVATRKVIASLDVAVQQGASMERAAADVPISEDQSER